MTTPDPFSTSEPRRPDDSAPRDGYAVPPDRGVPGGGHSGDDQHTYDLLVPPGNGGLSALWERLQLLLRRGGGRVMLIMLVVVAIPNIIWGILVDLYLLNAFTDGEGRPIPAGAEGELENFGALLGGSLLLSLVSMVLFTLLSALGWAAGIWAVTQLAAGRLVAVGEALRHGVRRLVPMFGWYLLYSVMITLGAMACLLPGLYLAVAAGLFSFVVMYERGANPFGRSFRLVHGAFGMVLGRMALLALFAVSTLCVVTFCFGMVSAFSTADSARGVETGEAATFSFTQNVLTQLLSVPLMAVALCTMLLIYTQVRHRLGEPVSTPLLRQALEQDEPTGPAGFGGPTRY